MQPSATDGPARNIIIQRSGSHVYVFPLTAQRYLGKFLDPALFDVTRLAAAAEQSERQPVRISYRGAVPEAAGVRITAASEGTASGYLTPSSAAAFGRALTEQWKADQQPGRSERKSLFAGVARISAAGTGSNQAFGHVSAAATTYPLTLQTIAPDGGRLDPLLTLINVDNGNAYLGGPRVDGNGVARVSVPKGTYSVLGTNWDYDGSTNHLAMSIVTVNEFKVTGSGQTMTVDFRTATVSPLAVSVPKAARLDHYSFDWIRKDGTADHYGVGSGTVLSADSSVLLAPSKAAKVGSLDIVQGWNLTEPVSVPTYTYSLAARTKMIPAQPAAVFTAADLGTVKAAYYGEGPAVTGGFGRTASFPELGGVGVSTAVQRGIRRTEYVGALGGKPIWSESVNANIAAPDYGGMIYGAGRSISAGQTQSVNWLKGPLGAAFDLQPGVAASDFFCRTCRSGNTMELQLAGFTDSDLTHTGYLALEPKGPQVTRFKFYRNGKLVSSKPNVLGGAFAVSTKKAKYTAVLEVDRRSWAAAQSTRTKTELTFVSAKNAGRKLGSDHWRACLGSPCYVQPIAQARLSLPFSIDGTVPASKATVTVAVGQVQKASASASAATSAGLQIRPAGGAWTTIKLKAIGGGKYQGTLDSSKLAGSSVDVQFTGTNTSGSSFRQTVLKAYTVAG